MFCLSHLVTVGGRLFLHEYIVQECRVELVLPDMAHSCKSHMISPLPSKLKERDGIGQSWHHLTCPCYVYRKYWVWRNFWWFGGRNCTSPNWSWSILVGYLDIKMCFVFFRDNTGKLIFNTIDWFIFDCVINLEQYFIHCLKLGTLRAYFIQFGPLQALNY